MMVCLPLKLAFIAMSLQMTFNIKSEPERHLRSVNIRILRQNYLSLNYFEKKVNCASNVKEFCLGCAAIHIVIARKIIKSVYFDK